MSGRSCRRKGHDWERWTARAFTEHGVRAVRNLEEVRSGNGGDLHFPDGEPLAVQCKCAKRVDVFAALREAVEAAAPGELPIAVLRRSGAGSRPPEDLAVLRLGDLLPRLAALLEAEAGTDA